MKTMRVLLSWILMPSVLLGAAPQAPGTAQDELATGIRQVREGEFDAAIVTLDGAARRLTSQSAPPAEIARAYVYLAITYMGLAQQEAAKVKFLDALKADRTLELSPREFPPNIIEMFTRVKNEGQPAAPAPGVVTAGAAAPAAPAPAPVVAAPAKGKSKLPLVLIGVGGAGVAGIALAAGGGGGGGGSTPSTPATTPAPAATPTPAPSGNFSAFLGRYPVSFTRRSECFRNDAIFTLAGNGDGSGFAITIEGGSLPVVATLPGTIQSDGQFRTNNSQITGQTNGRAITGRWTSGDCIVDFSGNKS